MISFYYKTENEQTYSLIHFTKPIFLTKKIFPSMGSAYVCIKKTLEIIYFIIDQDQSCPYDFCHWAYDLFSCRAHKLLRTNFHMLSFNDNSFIKTNDTLRIKASMSIHFRSLTLAKRKNQIDNSTAINI